MGSSFYPELTKLLKHFDCEFIRQGKGSHEIWRSPITGKFFSVPVTINKKPTANAILKQAGINHRF